ncbi:hypothetical protein SynA1840_01727 [Synechococcus sp. A18-40]|nr:hypothetical protein SynA1840_01727 [Synechococcus sp. A18-40]
MVVQQQLKLSIEGSQANDGHARVVVRSSSLSIFSSLSLSLAYDKLSALVAVVTSLNGV